MQYSLTPEAEEPKVKYFAGYNEGAVEVKHRQATR